MVQDEPILVEEAQMNIIGTGLSGLVGSRIVELLQTRHSFEDLSLDTGVDITQENAVKERITKSVAPWVFHFAAKTDVDGAEAERALGQNSPTWIVNVKATEHIARVCYEAGKRLLYISTDYVFDGTKEFYTEEDAPNPQGFYAFTKYEGEKRVGEDSLIVRIANPYRKPDDRPDFVHKILGRLSAGLRLEAPSDQLFIPTLIDDIAYAIEKLIEREAFGIYHIVGSQALSPYEAAKKIAIAFRFDPALVGETTFAAYFEGRAPRPRRAVLKNDKIAKFGIKMHSFDEGLEIIHTPEVNGN